MYRALAQICGINAGKPEEVLLLAEVSNGRVVEEFSDLKASAPEPLHSLQAHHPPHLLAYLYPSPDCGPLAPDLRRVHVMHR